MLLCVLLPFVPVRVCVWLCVYGVSAVAGGKPAIYWPQTETQPGSLFLVFGQRLEMNQRTVSQSATIRSTEISDVSLLHAALLQLTAHLILIYFFSSPLPTRRIHQSWAIDCGLWGCVNWQGQRKQLALTQILAGLFLRYTSGVCTARNDTTIRSN